MDNAKKGDLKCTFLAICFQKKNHPSHASMCVLHGFYLGLHNQSQEKMLDVLFFVFYYVFYFFNYLRNFQSYSIIYFFWPLGTII
jgi:hypothetical protein